MTIDTPTRRLDWRGRLVGTDRMAKATRQELRDLAEQFPVGTRIVHACGREGTVALDEAAHVPGLFLDGPSTVCLAGPAFSEPMVFAHWENEAEIVWGVWVPVGAVRRVASQAINRPGNKAKARIGGRR